MSRVTEPRNWRVLPVDDRTGLCHVAAGLSRYGYSVTLGPMDPETAELIVRMVNAEPEVVAALERARRTLLHCGGLAGHYGHADAAEQARVADEQAGAARALLRGDAPADPTR